MATDKKKLPKHPRHHHYWIDDNILYETYTTIRGPRYMSVLEVNGMDDCDICDKDMIKHIETKYLNNNE
jgi:hypothetical protein